MENTHFIDKEPNKYEALTELHKQQIRSMNEEQATRVLERLEYAWDLREKMDPYQSMTLIWERSKL